MSSIKDSGKNKINILIKQAIKAIGLTEDEIDLYFATTRRDIISIGEITNISNKTKEEALKIVEKFLEKGLFKEIAGITPHFKALAPYTALINQLDTLNKLISDIQEAFPPKIEEYLSLNNFNDYNKIITDLKENSLSQVDNQKAKAGKITSEIEGIGKISELFNSLKEHNMSVIESHINNISQQFNLINDRLSSSLSSKIEEFNAHFSELNKNTNQKLRGLAKTLEANIPKMKESTAQSLNNLNIGPVKNTVIQVINNLIKRWVDDITGDLVIITREVQGQSINGLKEVTENLKTQLESNENIINEVLDNTTQNYDSQLVLKIDNSMRNSGSEITEIISSNESIRKELNGILIDIADNLNSNISKAEENILGLSEGLKKSLSEKVIDILKEGLAKVSDSINISRNTLNELWEQAKQEEKSEEVSSEIPQKKVKKIKVSPAIFNKIDEIIEIIDNLDGSGIFSSLDSLKEIIYETVGYIPIVREINQYSTPYKRRRKPVDQSEKEKILNQLNLWRKQLLN